jgi:ribosomal protein L35
MLKTKKAVQKRIKITKNKKSLHRPIKQNHFKSKLTGRDNQKKRHHKGFYKADEKVIKKFLPYNIK